MTIRAIAASAAIASVLLTAVPAAAMASTGSGAKPTPPRPCAAAVTAARGGPALRVACCGRPVVVIRHRGAAPVPLRFVPVRACAARSMRFDMPAFASTATEVSGPRLSAHDLVIYQRKTFMIESVHGRAFTLARLPVLAARRSGPVRRPWVTAIKIVRFRNGATAITDGRAQVLGGPLVIVVRARSSRLSRP